MYSERRADEGSKSARASSVVGAAAMADEQAGAAVTRFFTYMFTSLITRARQERLRSLLDLITTRPRRVVT